jgi:hypothetical protein
MWAIVLGMVFAAFAIRARSLRKPVYYICEWSLTAGQVLRGFLQRPAHPREFGSFPVEFDIVADPTSSTIRGELPSNSSAPPFKVDTHDTNSTGRCVRSSYQLRQH